MRERLPLYDRAKGIGIILLVFGHLFSYGSLPFSFIFSFHMPLFFFISGMLLKPSLIKNKHIEIRRIFVKYIVPYLFFYFLGFIITAIFWGFPSIKKLLYEMFFYIGPDTINMGALWFLGILAISIVICLLLITLQNNYHIDTLLIVLVLSILSVLLEKIPFIFPFRIKTISAAVLFIWIGYTYKNKILELIKCDYIIKLIIPLSVLFILLAYLNRTVNIAIPEYNNFVFYVATALIGIILTLFLSQSDNLKFCDFFGRNSLIIFATHGIWLRFYEDLIKIICNNDYQLMVNIPPYLCVLGGIIIIILSIPTVYIIEPAFNYFRKKLIFFLDNHSS